MLHRRMRGWPRGVLALVALVLGLGACRSDGTGANPADLPGEWRATLQMGVQRTEYRLELTARRYVWTEETYHPEGRPEDGLTARVVHSGAWEMRGDRLALYQEAWSIWTHWESHPIRTHVPAWDENNRIETLRGNQMTILFDPPPHMSYMRPPLNFERVR